MNIQSIEVVGDSAYLTIKVPTSQVPAIRERYGFTGRVQFDNPLVTKSNTSGYRGVSLNKPTGTWKARIYYNGKQKTIGYYRTAEDAHMARLAFMQRPKLTLEQS
jgi:hypothetical protein